MDRLALVFRGIFNFGLVLSRRPRHECKLQVGQRSVQIGGCHGGRRAGEDIGGHPCWAADIGGGNPKSHWLSLDSKGPLKGGGHAHEHGPNEKQRLEEVHTSIHLLHMSPGRSLDPPAMSSRLRLREHSSGDR